MANTRKPVESAPERFYVVYKYFDVPTVRVVIGRTKTEQEVASMERLVEYTDIRTVRI